MIAHSSERTTGSVAPATGLFSPEVLGTYRLLLSALPAPPEDSPGGPILGLTSCDCGEGVSTVAAQLAGAAASAGLGRVLLVDANLARPAAHRFFGLGPRPGLVEVLLDGAVPADVIQASGLPSLSVLAAGRLVQAQEALALGGALQALKPDFELVVVDLPECRSGPLAARLAAQLDGVLLVIEAEGPRPEAVEREKELLVQAGAPLLGAVLNKRRQYLPRWLERYL
jgi:Mrp family chromosome partitioning ATPase